MARRSKSRPTAPATTRRAATMPFGRQNYRLLGAAVGLVVLGYAVMLADNAGGDAVDSPLSLVVAPLLLLAGYVGVAVAVVWGAPTDAGPEPGDAPDGDPADA